MSVAHILVGLDLREALVELVGLDMKGLS